MADLSGREIGLMNLFVIEDGVAWIAVTWRKQAGNKHFVPW